MGSQPYQKPKVGQSAYFCFLAYLLLLYSCSNIEVSEAPSFYHTPYGSQNHLLTCKMIENTAAKVTIEEALEQGFTPCTFCDPPALTQLDDNFSSLSIGPPRPGGKEESAQCLGVSKKGVRCLHSTKNANGYCS